MFGYTSVEVTPVQDAVQIRDPKDQGAGPVLQLSRPDWDDFLSGIPIDALTVSEHDRVTGHHGAWVHTRWHLRDRVGAMLHFTEAEWTTFWDGALDEDSRSWDSCDPDAVTRPAARGLALAAIGAGRAVGAPGDPGLADRAAMEIVP